MSTLVQIAILPRQQEEEAYILEVALEKAKLRKNDIKDWRIRKRSIDARREPIKINLQIEFWLQHEERESIPPFIPKNVSKAKPIAIIGAGPAGLYAALRAIEAGLKPIIFERGKDVKARRRDLAKINKEQIVNPESNYCFGEGGAGTYSDGKLYTRSKKRGNVLKAMEWFVHFGADADILVDAHPHIGTNKLPKIITAMREAILEHGGEVHFDSKLTDLKLEEERIVGIQINNKKWLKFTDVILATGHSARDVFYLLHKKNIKIEAKPFAIGVRVEHQQQLIDTIQYHGDGENPYLPPASYSLVEQVDGLGVYSFCMCPGGIIAPCATEQEEVVTNGWSPSKRNNPYANSGIVVSVEPKDLPNYKEGDPFVCLDFQKEVRKSLLGGSGKNATSTCTTNDRFCRGKGVIRVAQNFLSAGNCFGRFKYNTAFLAFQEIKKGVCFIWKKNERVLYQRSGFTRP